VKSVVPIWKKEYFEEGTAWVVGQHEVDVKGPEPHGTAH
jgi:molybdopterin synthase catalytic subunit